MEQISNATRITGLSDHEIKKLIEMGYISDVDSIINMFNGIDQGTKQSMRSEFRGALGGDGREGECGGISMRQRQQRQQQRLKARFFTLQQTPPQGASTTQLEGILKVRQVFDKSSINIDIIYNLLSAGLSPEDIIQYVLNSKGAEESKKRKFSPRQEQVKSLLQKNKLDVRHDFFTFLVSQEFTDKQILEFAIDYVIFNFPKMYSQAREMIIGIESITDFMQSLIEYGGPEKLSKVLDEKKQIVQKLCSMTGKSAPMIKDLLFKHGYDESKILGQLLPRRSQSTQQQDQKQKIQEIKREFHCNESVARSILKDHPEILIRFHQALHASSSQHLTKHQRQAMFKKVWEKSADDKLKKKFQALLDIPLTKQRVQVLLKNIGGPKPVQQYLNQYGRDALLRMLQQQY
jgi:hypothetical protein